MMTIHEVGIRKKDAGVVSGVVSIKRIFEDENIQVGESCNAPDLLRIIFDHI